MDANRDEPLKDEAAKRGEWRGDERERPRPEAPGHSLPASEDEDERLGGGPGAPGPTITPPD